jgi:hypothetical protein
MLIHKDNSYLQQDIKRKAKLYPCMNYSLIKIIYLMGGNYIFNSKNTARLEILTEGFVLIHNKM